MDIRPWQEAADRGADRLSVTLLSIILSFPSLVPGLLHLYLAILKIKHRIVLPVINYILASSPPPASAPSLPRPGGSKRQARQGSYFEGSSSKLQFTHEVCSKLNEKDEYCAAVWQACAAYTLNAGPCADVPTKYGLKRRKEGATTTGCFQEGIREVFLKAVKPECDPRARTCLGMGLGPPRTHGAGLGREL